MTKTLDPEQDRAEAHSLILSLFGDEFYYEWMDTYMTSTQRPGQAFMNGLGRDSKNYELQAYYNRLSASDYDPFYREGFLPIIEAIDFLTK